MEESGGGLGYELMMAAHAWRSQLGAALAPVGLTPPQFFLLASTYRLSRGGSAPMQREVAMQTATDLNVASQVVRALEQRGLLRRASHPDDSRALALTLTPEGTDLARRSTALARSLNRRFFGAVDHDVLSKQLRRLTEAER